MQINVQLLLLLCYFTRIDLQGGSYRFSCNFFTLICCSFAIFFPFLHTCKIAYKKKKQKTFISIEIGCEFFFFLQMKTQPLQLVKQRSRGAKVFLCAVFLLFKMWVWFAIWWSCFGIKLKKNSNELFVEDSLRCCVCEYYACNYCMHWKWFLEYFKSSGYWEKNKKTIAKKVTPDTAVASTAQQRKKKHKY